MSSTARSQQMSPVAAAGALLWRHRRGRLEVALIHRPKYDDWSWPKGKLDPGELWAGAAAREVEEETGLVPRLGITLPTTTYSSASAGRKEVRYWAAEAIGGSGELEHEVDQVDWLTVAQAVERLTYERDAHQLQALVKANRGGYLQTWPLLVVRHAHAVPRSSWREDDTARPLNADGEGRAEAIAPLLAAYGVTRLVSSPSRRCVDTVLSFAEQEEVVLRTKKGLSEEGFEEHPDKVVKHIEKLLTWAHPSAICTHRPLLPTLLKRLALRAAPESEALRSLTEAAAGGLDKGEVLVCHLVGRAADAAIVSVERHPLD